MKVNLKLNDLKINVVYSDFIEAFNPFTFNYFRHKHSLINVQNSKLHSDQMQSNISHNNIQI